MFPGKPICIDVQDAGHQDYLVMIFSIAVVGLAGFGMLSALAHFILRLKTKPARKLQIPEFAKKSLRYRVSLDFGLFIIYWVAMLNTWPKQRNWKFSQDRGKKSFYRDDHTEFWAMDQNLVCWNLSWARKTDKGTKSSIILTSHCNNTLIDYKISSKTSILATTKTLHFTKSKRRDTDNNLGR